MKLGKKQLDLKDAIRKEWIISNGIGGFTSSTVIGANTRRYHGLLVAPLLPPARRHLLISKLDESIYIGNEKFDLYTNICKNYVAHGYKYLEHFEKEYLPKFTYKVKDVTISKEISMVYKRNTVVVVYKIKTNKEDVKLVLAPIVSFRDFHAMNTGHNYNISQKIDGRKVRLEIDGNSHTPIYTYLTDGEYIEHKNDTFENIYYLKEDERGFMPEENLAVSGRYEVYIPAETTKTITFVGSLEDNVEIIDGEKVIQKETERIEKTIKDAGLLKNKQNKQDKEYDAFVKDLLIAVDTFIIDRPSFGTKSILAGYPWFLDWGRDSFIAFEGLLLITKRFEDAKQVFRTFT